MRITRRLHDSKKGRLLVWEQTPGTSLSGNFALSRGGNKETIITYKSSKHEWRVVLSEKEMKKIKEFN
jgi:hypothetical protein